MTLSADKSPIFQSDHVSLTVANIGAAIDFYTRVLGAEVLYRMGPFDAREAPREADGKDWTQAHINVTDARLKIAMLAFPGGLRLEVFEYERPRANGSTERKNSDVGASHLCFKVENLDAATAHLERNGCNKMPAQIVSEGAPCPDSVSIYILDPFGHQLELVEYADQAH